MAGMSLAKLARVADVTASAFTRPPWMKGAAP